ncbi:hypothetical protein AZA_15380 [Nitrospirillum viridazoti Y2]|nr:hypothetical protein AZA_15380 [Nitrospirillum amazonense Y2]
MTTAWPPAPDSWNRVCRVEGWHHQGKRTATPGGEVRGNWPHCAHPGEGGGDASRVRRPDDGATRNHPDVTGLDLFQD